MVKRVSILGSIHSAIECVLTYIVSYGVLSILVPEFNKLLELSDVLEV